MRIPNKFYEPTRRELIMQLQIVRLNDRVFVVIDDETDEIVSPQFYKRQDAAAWVSEHWKDNL